MQTIRMNDSGQPYRGCAAVVVFAAFRHVGALLIGVPVSWVRTLNY